MSKVFEPFGQLKQPATLAKPLPPLRRSVRVVRARAPIHREPMELVRAITVIKKHWRLSLLFAVLVSGTCTVITFLTKPIYEPVARIEIDPPGSEIFSLQRPGGDTNESAFVETQAQDLRQKVRRWRLSAAGSRSPEMRPVTSSMSASQAPIHGWLLLS